MRLTPRQALALFGIGALGGLVGDACHVTAGTTVYLDQTFPFVWKSQLWFPFAVGLATVVIGEVRLRLGPARPGSNPVEAAAAIASVVGLYALTAVVTDEEPLAATVLIWSLAILIATRIGGGLPALACGLLAAVLGPLAEVLIVEAGLAMYSPAADGLLGVAEWLPALYFAFGVVAARLAELLARP
ncbi:MAG: hypothetical protein M3Y34_08905 [Actinomycetota bacterium]|nr:hypothetical protein [Actinomycetota bacterium]